jgi:hypothetical protein
MAWRFGAVFNPLLQLSMNFDSRERPQDVLMKHIGNTVGRISGSMRKHMKRACVYALMAMAFFWNRRCLWKAL